MGFRVLYRFIASIQHALFIRRCERIPGVASLVRLLKLSLSLRPFIVNFCPAFVLQFLPLLALVPGSQAAGTQSGFAIEFTNIDAG
jgi:hypothetical protein